MRVIVVLLASTWLLSGSANAAQNAPDNNSIELVVRGCLKGREVAADQVSGLDELRNETGMIFRLSAKGEVNNAMKRQNGRYIEVTGRVKKTALASPGLKLGGGRIVIGGGPVAQDPTRNPARNAANRMVPMDASAIEGVESPFRECRP